MRKGRGAHPWRARELGGAVGVEDAGDSSGVFRADSLHRLGRLGKAEQTAALACPGAAGFDGEIDGAAPGLRKLKRGTAASATIRSARRQLLAPGGRGERGASFSPLQFARGDLKWWQGDGGNGDSTAARRAQGGRGEGSRWRGTGGNGLPGKWGSGWGDHHGHGGRHAGMGSGGSHGMAPVAKTGTVEKKEFSFCEKTPWPKFPYLQKGPVVL